MLTHVCCGVAGTLQAGFALLSDHRFRDPHAMLKQIVHDSNVYLFGQIGIDPAIGCRVERVDPQIER